MCPYKICLVMEGLCIINIFCAGGLLFIFGLVTVLTFFGAVRQESAVRREFGGRDALSSAQVVLRRTPAELFGAVALLRRTYSA